MPQKLKNAQQQQQNNKTHTKTKETKINTTTYAK